MTTVFIISAPSGSGKSTLVSEIRKIVSGLDFSISYTTRQPRGSEQNAKEYFFISREEFENMVSHDEFLEHADVFGYFYGTARHFLADACKKGTDLLLDIDVQGAQQIKEKLPEAVSIFILPPDRTTLEWRLRNRGSDDEKVIKRRLATARREIENYWKYDYILVNDRLNESIDALKLILQAERERRSGVQPSDDDDAIVAKASRYKLENMRERVEPILASFRNNSEGRGR